jgi:hypothetical protein
MELTGTVVDQANGKPIANVTIWEIAPDGRSAEIIGYSDGAGKYDVYINSSASNINFVTDGYTGTNIPAGQALLSDQVLLAKDGALSAKFTLSGMPAWIWVLLAGIGIFFLGDGKRKK